jgi:hypothetical protein
MNANDNNIFSHLFLGQDKYIAGLLIILASVINYVTHFKKANFSPVVTYGILLAIVIMGSVLAHL